MVNTTPVTLSTGLGEIMAPQTLMTPLLMTPEGQITVEPGALHGRSEMESGLRFVKRREELVEGAQRHWLVWVAIELDAATQPVRYKGIAVSELWVDRANQVGYKNLAASVNRISEAIRGGVNLKAMTSTEKAAIKQQLLLLSSASWEQSAPSLKDALA